MGLKIIILAAGKGKRMVSELPKILHPLAGVPMLERVVNTAKALDPDQIFVVYGNGGSMVKEALDYLPVEWIHQPELLGTGHAVLQAIPHCDDDDRILVLYGDVPLISIQTLQHLLLDTQPNGLGLIVADIPNPEGLGRIIRNEMGNIVAIVEHKDANPQQLEISEINTGILTTTAKNLKAWLPTLGNNNNQQEYYLTDIVAEAVAQGYPVGGVMAYCVEEVQGVNDRWQLVLLERYFQIEQAKALAYEGVTVKDPTRLDIRGTVDIAADVVIDVNVVMEGHCSIGAQSTIGPNVILKNAIIGENVSVQANTVIEHARVEAGACVGPFARIRPESIVGPDAKVGNFVELKKTHLGEGSKASHLTYLGDAIIGRGVNIGAGTITCNYDGVNKYPTEISDGAFIGSNTSLISPIKIGENAYVAAGSAISGDAPSAQLTIARAKQTTVSKWKPPLPKKDISKVSK